MKSIKNCRKELRGMTDSNGSGSTPTEFTLRDLQTSVPDDAAINLAEKLNNIVGRVRQRIISDSCMQDILRDDKLLQSADDTRNQAPEDFTKNLIIDELLDHFDYPYRTQEVNTPTEDEDQWVDYSVSLKDFSDVESTQLLIEAEPINKNLNQQKHGIGQVKRWLHHEPFETNFGMATDGLKWILLKKDPDTHSINKIGSINLQEICLALFENHATSKDPVESVLDEEDQKVLKTFYEVFHFDNFLSIAAGVQSVIRKKKKEVSEAFYDEYIELVFGIIDEDTEGRDTDRCLIGDGIEEPAALNYEYSNEEVEEQRRLFAVQLMNRLVFIKFLEDTGIVGESLLSDVKKAHKEGKHLSDFYQAFIKPLIYNVFNTPQGNNRRDKIQERDEYRTIPYLNGGLFRENLPREKKYHVTDSVLIAIVDLLEDYKFSTTGGPDELDPSILGTVFEKTINYLAGETGAQKDLGAYYTPDNITRFCAEKSVRESLLNRFKQVLRDEWGWREGEVAHYEEIYELIDGLSPNQDVVDSLLDEVNEFYVLDPACGSGHFLTSVLNEIISVRRSLYEKHEDSPSVHLLKRQTVLKNLYGVDIVGPGVEITKLRLWLSIISELAEADIDDIDPGELALPNVAFNIREGNSLVGYTDTQRLRIEEDDGIEHQQSPLDEWFEKSVEELVKERQEMVDEFKELYGEDAQALQDEIDDKDEKYNRRLNQKLLDDLRDAGVAVEYDHDEIDAPDLPSESIHKVSVRFDDAIDKNRKEELSDKYQDETGMRINHGKGGYVSISLTHNYLSNTPDGRLQAIIDEVKDNISDLEIQRYLTLGDLDDLEWLHWPLEFYEVFKNGGFDIAIGNPPYGIDISDAESALREYADENHSSMVFASRAEDLINDDGQIAYVAPKVLTYAYSWTDARNHLLNLDLDYLIDLREAFDGVKQEQIILMFSTTEPDNNVIVGRREESANGNGERFFEQSYQQSAFDEDCFFMWVDDNNEELLTKLSGYDTFEDENLAEATKGIDAFKSYLTGDSNDLLAYRGDDVGQFRFVNKSYLDPSIKNRSDFHLAGHGQKKVVFQRILAHVTDPTDRIIIQCAVDYDEACVPDTAIHAIPNNHSLEFLCGLMNSSLFAWYAYNAIYNRAIRSMDLTPIYFGRLPAPPEEDDELIESVEEKTGEIQEMNSSQEDELLSKYEELNEAVFDLYQLDDDERNVIKAETPPRKDTLLNW